jgi:hypothetical protein
MLPLSCENVLKDLGINNTWFSRTTKCIPMYSCIYFTATRNITAFDIINVFENILNIGIVYEKNVNIVPVLNKNYNHVFFKIHWNDTVESANFVNELVVNSSIKVYHNKGYWVCRMSKHPLKLRSSKKRVNNASFYCNNSSSESVCEEQNITIEIKEGEALNLNEETFSNSNEEEDFYVIKEENIASAIE